MKIFLTILFILPSGYCIAQNVGIGTTTPVEKLDVNGNVNIAGVITTNGTGGAAGQVLTTGSGGTMQWADISAFKNIATFKNAGSGTWNIPDGVSRVMVEVWGGGGGAISQAGGGGGGYVAGIFEVDPANSFAYTVGSGGAGSTGDAASGTSSSVTYNSSVTLTGLPGGGGDLGGTPNVGSLGGGYTVSPATFNSYWGKSGEAGEQKKVVFFQASATVFYESFTGGRGGDAGNTFRTGGDETYGLFNIATSTVTRFDWGSSGKAPGGGGSAGNGFISPGPSFSAGYSGAAGMVIFRY